MITCFNVLANKNKEIFSKFKIENDIFSKFSDPELNIRALRIIAETTEESEKIVEYVDSKSGYIVHSSVWSGFSDSTFMSFETFYFYIVLFLTEEDAVLAKLNF
jgi:hypothetical protein